MWVHVEIKATTSSIIIVMLSTKKPSSILNSPISNHVKDAS